MRIIPMLRQQMITLADTVNRLNDFSLHVPRMAAPPDQNEIEKRVAALRDSARRRGENILEEVALLSAAAGEMHNRVSLCLQFRAAIYGAADDAANRCAQQIGSDLEISSGLLVEAAEFTKVAYGCDNTLTDPCNAALQNISAYAVQAQKFVDGINAGPLSAEEEATLHAPYSHKAGSDPRCAFMQSSAKLAGHFAEASGTVVKRMSINMTHADILLRQIVPVFPAYEGLKADAESVLKECEGSVMRIHTLHSHARTNHNLIQPC